jgi:phage-related protein
VENNFIRNIFYYKHFYLDFFSKLKPEVQKKFNWTLQLIATLDRVPEKYFKHITGSTGLYEIRVEVGSNIFRIFCCFDEGKVVVLFNGFQKKTQKTPKNVIDKANRLMNEYFESKTKNNENGPNKKS